MKSIACILVLIFVLSIAAVAAEPAKVKLSVRDLPMKEAMSQLADQAGVSIIVDPKIDSKVTMSLGETGLVEALDVITKVNKVTWKKVQFAKPADSQVTMEQIKSSILALASMPLLAISVDDGTGKPSTFTNSAASSADMSAVKLPEGYTMATAYVVLAPAAPADAQSTTAAITDERVKAMAKEQYVKAQEMAKMSPEERKQMYQSEIMGYANLRPEVRKQLMQDRMAAYKELDPAIRKQLHSDMRGMGGPRGPRVNRPDGHNQ